jgi:hypothetical protein
VWKKGKKLTAGKRVRAAEITSLSIRLDWRWWVYGTFSVSVRQNLILFDSIFFDLSLLW